MLSLPLIALVVLADANLKADIAPGSTQDVVPAPLKNVDVVERLNEMLPLDLTFVDSENRVVKLRDYFDGVHPVVLTLGYYRCTTLCGLVFTGTARSLKRTGLKLGDDFKALTVSINPKEGASHAAEAQRGATATLIGKEDPERARKWAFLATKSEEPVRKLADAVGFKYAYDAETQQFAHAAVVFILTPEGKISRYFYGMEFSPEDLRLSLVEAADGKVGTTLDRVLLTCFKYDPATRKYGLYLSRFLRGGALTVFFGLALMLGVLWRREFKNKAPRT